MKKMSPALVLAGYILGVVNERICPGDYLLPQSAVEALIWVALFLAVYLAAKEV